MTEEQMRDMECPWPHSIEELVEFIKMLEGENDDYGKAVYIMSLAATAAFNYASHVAGTTGFQAGCASFDFMKRTKGIDGPFMLVRVSDCLYPQYDKVGEVADFIEKLRPWLKEKALAKLADDQNRSAHPKVIAHWKKLAGVSP
jgi:hypothetical protein